MKRSRTWTRPTVAAYASVGAWLTVESRLSVEARRLEGLLPRARGRIVAAPHPDAARWRCARTARSWWRSPGPWRRP